MAADLSWLESHTFWLIVTVPAPLSLNLPLVLMVLSPLGITGSKFTELEVFDWNHWEHTLLALQSNWNASLWGEDWSPQVPFGPFGPESSFHEAGSFGSRPQTETFTFVPWWALLCLPFKQYQLSRRKPAFAPGAAVGNNCVTCLWSSFSGRQAAFHEVPKLLTAQTSDFQLPDWLLSFWNPFWTEQNAWETWLWGFL